MGFDCLCVVMGLKSGLVPPQVGQSLAADGQEDDFSNRSSGGREQGAGEKKGGWLRGQTRVGAAT